MSGGPVDAVIPVTRVSEKLTAQDVFIFLLIKHWHWLIDWMICKRETRVHQVVSRNSLLEALQQLLAFAII